MAPYLSGNDGKSGFLLLGLACCWCGRECCLVCLWCRGWFSVLVVPEGLGVAGCAGGGGLLSNNSCSSGPGRAVHSLCWFS